MWANNSQKMIVQLACVLVTLANLIANVVYVFCELTISVDKITDIIIGAMLSSHSSASYEIKLTSLQQLLIVIFKANNR